MPLPSIALFYRPHIIQEALQLALENVGFARFVGCMPSQEGTLDFLLDEMPDLLVVDLKLPRDRNSLAVPKFTHIETYRSQIPETKLVVVSEENHRLYGAFALKKGAKGYVRADEGLDEVTSATKRVLGGGIACPDDVNQFLLGSYANRNYGKDIETLSTRELEVFALLGEPHTKEQIGDLLGIAVKTVETYQARVKEKLGLENTLQLRHAAFRFDLFGTYEPEHDIR